MTLEFASNDALWDEISKRYDSFVCRGVMKKTENTDRVTEIIHGDPVMCAVNCMMLVYDGMKNLREFEGELKPWDFESGEETQDDESIR